MVTLDEIIIECRRYNKLAQKLLYERYASRMKGLCLRYVNDPDALKDIVQEGFIKVFSNIKQYSGRGSFEGWMKRIFINTAITYLRKNSMKDKYFNIEDFDESYLYEKNQQNADRGYDFDERTITPDQNSAELLLFAEFTEQDLLRTLNKLPEKYRIVFNLYCIENVKHEEIAEILNIDVATSRTRLLRARNIIQKELYTMCIIKLSQ